MLQQDRKLITKLAIESAKAENAAVRAVRRILQEIRRKILDNPRRKISLKPLRDKLARLMMIQHGLAYKRFSKAHNVLKMDALTPLERALRTIEGLNISELREKYDVEAFTALQDAEELVNERIKNFVVSQVRQGASVRTARKELANRFEQFGITPDGYIVDRIFRTQSQIAFGAGKWLAEQDPDISDILWGYRYATVGDDRVRPEHAQFEGVILPKEDKFWDSFYPPNGYNCRCIAIPLTVEERSVKPPKQLAEVTKGFDQNFGAKLFT